MTWELSVAGTVHLDDITTPHGHNPRQFGGSAIFFALAAGQHAPVHLNGIVGRDCEALVQETLRGLPVDLAGLAVGELPTFRWHAVHDFERWIAREVKPPEPNCDPQWRPRLSPASAAAQVLFLGSMDPRLQLSVLAQSHAGLIGSDSMTTFMGRQHDLVENVALGSDILFLNRHELASLVGGEAPWEEMAAGLIGRGRLRAVVVKLGPEGACVVTRNGLTARPAAPVRQVIDPTGAGDALAGGFLGLCAAHERDDDAFLVEALEEGLRCAAAAISDFGVTALRSMVVG